MSNTNTKFDLGQEFQRCAKARWQTIVAIEWPETKKRPIRKINALPLVLISLMLIPIAGFGLNDPKGPFKDAPIATVMTAPAGGSVT